MTFSKDNIIDYYDTCEIDYRLLWNLDESLALHYGFWDQTTHHFSEALEKENEVMATLANIKKSDRVLDAGCGVGGSAIYLAQHIGCKATGITLSARQVQTATENAKKRGVSSLVRFEKRDYTNTKLSDASFDVVWATESVLYAKNKEDFIQEAYRLLKKDGRLIVADFFASKKRYEKAENQLMNNWLAGWAVDSLATPESFSLSSQKVGFKSIRFIDKTKSIYPSAKRLYLFSFPGIVVGKILEILHLRSHRQMGNVWAAYYQYRALKRGLWKHGIIYGIR